MKVFQTISIILLLLLAGFVGYRLSSVGVYEEAKRRGFIDKESVAKAIDPISCKYEAFVTDVYDGDTVTVNFKLGLGVHVDGQKIRLYGIDAPELRGEEREAGLVTRDKLRELILNKQIVIDTHGDKKGKYGRWLGTITIDKDGQQVNVNEHLMQLGLAERYEE